ncbi:hypothetical protein HHI36_000495 [Cryptolaemus montrouzieri]|uniref:Uncharacterized protein n=1 Tax=Cryptolaemus montrouzieri TaxID=559131 RepID=A0ABD2P589_9CUCU
MNENRDGIENPNINKLDGPSTSRVEIAQRTNETSPSSSVLQLASASNSSKNPSDNLSLVTPEDIQPHPKIAGSLKRKIEEQTARRQKINRIKTTKRGALAEKQNISQNIPKQDPKKKRKDDSDSEGSFQNDENESGPEKISEEEIDETRQPAGKDWILVIYKGKKQRYVRQILATTASGEYKVNSAKQNDNNKFKWPETEDISNMDSKQIELFSYKNDR